MPVKGGCSVSTTSADTSAFQRTPSSTSARTATSRRCRTLSPLGPASGRARSLGCSPAVRRCLRPAGTSGVRAASPWTSRTSAEVSWAPAALSSATRWCILSTQVNSADESSISHLWKKSAWIHKRIWLLFANDSGVSVAKTLKVNCLFIHLTVSS